MTFTNNADGSDVAFYQGNTNFDKMAKTQEYAGIRIGQGDYLDSKAERNWKLAKGALLRKGYWFLDWRSSAPSIREQAELFKKFLGDDLGELPPVLDFELPWSGWTSELFPDQAKAFAILKEFKKTLGVQKMILYINSSSLSMILDDGLTIDQIREAKYDLMSIMDQEKAQWLRENFDLWIAAWPSIKRTKTDGTVYWDAVRQLSEIPDGWEPQTFGWDFSFWQYTCKLYGPDFGVESKDLDGNVSAFSVSGLYEYANQAPPIILPPDPEPEPEPEDPTGFKMFSGKIMKVRPETVGTGNLMIRNGPGVGNGVVNRLRADDEVMVFEEYHRSDGSVWVRIGIDQWSAMKHFSDRTQSIIEFGEYIKENN